MDRVFLYGTFPELPHYWAGSVFAADQNLVYRREFSTTAYKCTPLPAPQPPSPNVECCGA
ncbi:hypothetical protein MTY66_52130 [Mycolicibacterium sp. TY66]|nr:hypothetical protein MTY66_52130 [Mycolicibacterium sp. TY66]BCJ78770.1 hypothetical protein MTY81_01430 [Mycolicibacterium sp. TY81]